MSKIRKRQRKDKSIAYVVDLRDINGGEKTFRTRQDALAYEQAATADHTRGGHANPYFAPTFGAAALAWLKTEERRIASEGLGKGEYDNKIKTVEHLCGYKVHTDGEEFAFAWALKKAIRYPVTKSNIIPLREMKITDVRAGKIRQEVIPQLLEGCAHATAKKRWRHMKAIFAHAAEANDLASSPIVSVSFPKTRPHKLKRVQATSVDELIKKSTPQYQTILMFAAYTGLRFGEMVALTWDDIDFENNMVIVNKSKKKCGKIGETKTLAGERKVPIIPKLRAALLEHKIGQFYMGPRNLVFPSSTGEMVMDSANWRNRGITKALDKINMIREIEGKAPHAQFSFHDLRHFYASCLIFNSDLPPSIVTRLMGHADYSFTMAQYGHWFEDQERDIALGDKVAEALG